MTATAIVQAAQTILQAALVAAGYSVTVELGVPASIATPTGALRIYLFHDGSEDTSRVAPTVFDRAHTIPVRALRLMGDDDVEQAELDMTDLHTVMSDAFMLHRTVNGTCHTAVFGQRDQPRGAASPAYVAEGLVEYRQRWWTLTATEQVQFPFPTE